MLIAVNTTRLRGWLTVRRASHAATVANDANDVISVDNELYYTDTTDGNGAIEEFNPATQLNTLYQLPDIPATDRQPAEPAARRRIPIR